LRETQTTNKTQLCVLLRLIPIQKKQTKPILRALVPSWQNHPKPRKTGENHLKPPKTSQRSKKLHVIKITQSATYKKDENYRSKKLVNVNKGSTFAPATTTDVP
jgi:hypothetical protein